MVAGSHLRSQVCLGERGKVMMKQGVICILVLAFLGLVTNPSTALAELSGGQSGPNAIRAETAVIIAVATIVAVFGISYLMKKHKERSQEDEDEKRQAHATSFNIEERIDTNGETVIWCW